MGRLHSLDGLRGLAAIVVVAHHAMLTFPMFALPYLSAERAADGWPYILAYTPLHVFWEGRSAVYVFFVLSGVVLALPVLKRGKDFSWIAYYPQRLLRLYIPVWAAVILGIGWVLMVPRDAAMDSYWLVARNVNIDPGRVARDATLVFGPGDIVSPLWSLRWEILFSLFLPLFVWIGVRLTRFRWLLVGASLTLIAVGGAADFGWILYLPMFMLGVVIATALPGILERGRSTPQWMSIALTVIAPLFLVAPWLVRMVSGMEVLIGALEGVSALGALLAVYVTLTVPFVKRFLSTRVMQWFGLISFSLYLVHEPIVISFAFLFGEDLLLLAAVGAILISVPVAYGFYRTVEVPSHMFARWVGDTTRRKLGKRSAEHTQLVPD